MLSKWTYLLQGSSKKFLVETVDDEVQKEEPDPYAPTPVTLPEPVTTPAPTPSPTPPPTPAPTPAPYPKQAGDYMEGSYFQIK